jgi:hypothetical protein
MQVQVQLTHHLLLLAEANCFYVMACGTIVIFATHSAIQQRLSVAPAYLKLRSIIGEAISPGCLHHCGA